MSVAWARSWPKPSAAAQQRAVLEPGHTQAAPMSPGAAEGEMTGGARPRRSGIGKAGGGTWRALRVVVLDATPSQAQRVKAAVCSARSSNFNRRRIGRSTGAKIWLHECLRCPKSVRAWFKNAHFGVTLEALTRTLIGPALERVYASPWLAVLGASGPRESRVPQKLQPVSVRLTRQQLRRTLADSTGIVTAQVPAVVQERTAATSSSPCPIAAAGRSSCAAGC